VSAKICTAYAALTASVYLLAFGSGGYTNITLVKYFIFCVLTSLFLISMFIFARHGRRLTLTQFLVILYWFFSAVSTLLSEYRLDALTGMSRYEGLITITMYTAVFLLFSSFADADGRLPWVLGVSMFIFCLISFLQLLGYNPFGLFPNGTNYYGMNRDYSGQFVGTVGNAGLASSLLCVAIPVFWVSALRLKKYLLFLPAAICTALLLLIDIKAGILGVFGGGLISLPVVLPLAEKGKKTLWLALLLLAAAGLTALYFYDFGGNGTLWEAHELLHGNFSDDFGTKRIYIWKNVLELIPQRPLFGGGPDTLLHYMKAEFTRETESGAVISRTIDAAHNEYLNILVNQGAFALLSYLAALICSLIKWLKNKSTAGHICGAAVLCYCIGAFFGIGQSITAIYFWIAWGLLEASVNKQPAVSRKG
jgi:O-antigen ligase